MASRRQIERRMKKTAEALRYCRRKTGSQSSRAFKSCMRRNASSAFNRYFETPGRRKKRRR